MREGDATGALAALEQHPLPAAEAAYWKARALTMLGRLEEAAELYRQVPPEHSLYPYAARGLLYCAWKCPALPFAELAGSLTSCADASVARLALAALAEAQYTGDGAAETYEQLCQAAQQDEELQAVAQLLKLQSYRRRKDYDGGIEYARQLEQESSLPLLMRQRVRLALAELYYDKEQAEPPEATPSAVENNDEGKGEETLLQFITANPETPLLDEAFRRLYHHTGATGSDYARARLRDWSEDTAHPKRAALAFYILLQMNQVHGTDPSILVNRAAAELPGEPMTCTILQEHIRKLLSHGRQEEASRYLSLLSTLQKTPDARTLFLSAPDNREPADTAAAQEANLHAMQLFLLSAEKADSELLTPALVNALICAMRCGKQEIAEQLLAKAPDKRTKCALLLAHAGLLLQAEPARALRELTEAQKLDPTPEQQVDIELDIAQLELATAPEDTLQKLLDSQEEKRSAWTEPQQLRYAALVEKAADALGTPEKAHELLLRLYEQSRTPALKQRLALHLANRLAENKRHSEALDLLLKQAQTQPADENRADTLLFAGHEACKLGSLAALEEAVQLYEQSARQSSPLSPRAVIEQAATLVRINRTHEALALLHRLEQQTTPLHPGDRAHLLTVLADAHGLDMTPQSLATALACSERIETIPGISQAWRVRGYLQHAALCTRMGRHEEALADYRKALQAERARANANEPRSCFLLYYAAAGAVYQLLQMERYEEAANLADRAGAWPNLPNEPAGPKSEAFKRWAQSIRQTHYLPLPVLEDSDSLML